jgi:hypothetical protein
VEAAAQRQPAWAPGCRRSGVPPASRSGRQRQAGSACCYPYDCPACSSLSPMAALSFVCGPVCLPTPEQRSLVPRRPPRRPPPAARRCPHSPPPWRPLRSGSQRWCSRPCYWQRVGRAWLKATPALTVSTCAGRVLLPARLAPAAPACGARLGSTWPHEAGGSPASIMLHAACLPACLPACLQPAMPAACQTQRSQAPQILPSVYPKFLLPCSEQSHVAV